MLGNMTQQQQQQPAFFATPAEMVAIAAQQQPMQQPPAFLTTGAELVEVARSWPEELVTGFVPSAGVMVLAGAPGTGKSFVALSWAAAVAEGASWFGQGVRQAPVVYVLGEGWGSFGRRIEAWQTVNGRPIPDALYFVNGVPHGVNLADQEAVQWFIEGIMPVKPGLIIMDTFSMLARVGNENDNAEVAAVMANVNAIVQATGATVVLIHHVTKESRSVRGASAFVGNADTVAIAAEDSRKDAKPGTFVLSTDGAMGGKQRDGMPKTMGGFSIASPGVLARKDDDSWMRPPGLDESREKAMAAVKLMHQQDSNDEKEH